MSPARIDLVLVNPGDRVKTYQSLGSELSAVETPIWTGLFGTFALKKGLVVEIIDANAENISAVETAERIADLDPVLTAIVVYGHNPSASTQVMPSASEICREIKKKDPKYKVIMVGGHVAALPEQTMREEMTDFVASGEGLYTVVELVTALKEVAYDLSKVRGLWWRDDQDTLNQNLGAPLVMNLDSEIPGIAWDLLPIEKYRAHNWHCFGEPTRQPYAAIYTTLGCPYHCEFCCIQAPFKDGESLLGMKSSINSYRFWNPMAIVDQIEMLVRKYGIKSIKFADEMFVLNKKHVSTICNEIIRRGLDINVWAYARIDTMKDLAMMEMLKAAGINWLCPGIEAANPDVRQDIEKGYKQELIYKAMQNSRNAGIYIIGNYIFGLPEDNYDTMQETLNLAIELNTEFANFYSAMAYPGSALYQTAIKNKWPLPKTWDAYSQHSEETFPLPTKYLSGSEVLSFRDYAWHVYFENPRYVTMIENKFGLRVVEHIKEMTSHKLKRVHRR